MPGRRVLLVGWDAADWKVIHPLMDAGKMPTVRWLVDRGSMANLATLRPVLSPMLWTSIATGKRPAKHGIYGFSEPLPGGTGVRPVTNLSRKTKAIWNILSQQGLRSNVVGWWPSHPAEPINGCMVSNHFQQATGPPEQPWPTMPGSVYPRALTETLAPLRLNPNELLAEHILPFIPQAGDINQEQDGRLASCAKILAEATSVQAVATHLMQHEPWDFMAVYFDAIDHFCHAFMRYHPPKQEHISQRDFDLYSGVVEAAYRYHDMMLHTLMQMAGPQTTVILMSDHGFHPDHLRPRQIPAEPAGPAVEHRDFGIFAAAGPGICKDVLIHGLNLLDITPTLLALFGLPIGRDMDGKPALAAIEGEPQIEFIPSWDDVAGKDGRHPADKQLDAVESAEAIRQLVELGYIEPPGPNAQLAVRKTVRELRYNLARSHMHAGEHAAAAELLEQLYDDWPSEHRFGVQLAICLQALDRIADMRGVVQVLAERRKQDAQQARAELEEFTKQLRAGDETKFGGQPSSAKRLTRQQQHRLRQLRSRANYNRHAIAYLWGCVQFAEGDYKQAINSFAQASRRDSQRPGLHLQIGEAQLKLRHAGEAYASFRQAAEIDPDNPHAWCGMARAALRVRKAEPAARHALRSIGLLYHNPVPHYTLGVALARRGQTDQAVEALQAALAINPNFAAAHRVMAWLLGVRRGDPAGAAEHRQLARQMQAERRATRRKSAILNWSAGNWSTERIRSKLPSEVNHPVESAIVETPRTSELDADQQPIIIVSGLPRSGTSMLMQMLAAGGVPIFSDAHRVADEDNPRGYYEHEAAKRLSQDKSWLSDAGGKAVKIVAQLLPHLPADTPCRVILIERDLDEVLASQRKMLVRSGKPGTTLAVDRLKTVFSKQLESVARVLASRPAAQVLRLQHAAILRAPKQAAAEINQFLGRNLDEAAMGAAVDLSLYRNRS